MTAFARPAQRKAAALASGELSGRPYNAEPFAKVSCVGLRPPARGGRTIMAAQLNALLA